MNIGFANINLGVRGSSRRMVELSNHLIELGHNVTVYLPPGEVCTWLKLKAPIKDVNLMPKDKNDFLIYYGHKELFPLMQESNVIFRIFYVLGIGDESKLKNFDITQVKPLDYVVHHPREWKLFSNCQAMSNWINSFLDTCAYTVQGGVDHNNFHRIREPIAYKVVGSGSKREAEGTPELLEVFEQLKKLEKRCTTQLYAGYGHSQREIANILSSADVYIDAQRWGGWNNAVAEAMAIGAPTICTNIMGNLDFCEHEVNCLMVEPMDIKGMIDSTLRLFSDHDLRGEIANKARKTMQIYTWERAAKKWKIYWSIYYDL